jgi:putative ABC transport system permease protein
VLRSKRKLKPFEDNNFSINQLSMITDMLDSVFRVLNIAGFWIGFFALLVGMFSVANIMFVSVKERTNIIGIKKALGAKGSVILLEFLVESVILCIIGGIIGLVTVYLTLLLLSSITPFDMQLSVFNTASGVGISIAVGIIAGIIPAFQASKMNPVDAIRA